MSARISSTRAMAAAEIFRSSAYSWLTSSMMEAMHVLKCQRVSKSSVILRRVWWSLRRTLRSEAPERSSAGVLRVALLDENLHAVGERVCLDIGLLGDG